ncbi:MAG: ferredoxin--NADP(+) reductase [Flavobacteriales bacterium]|nr:ferredoxin--NADP(+) reductase [Flavobacteriales bacterium]|tara:strand:- start:1411 stop:2418 length:1008 start_codon:yes stop_codon:yes gene_type:complete
MIKTDVLIIGAGPCGLFAVFEAGLLKMKCHLIDSLPQAGGQCAEIYPKKPIYDIPAFPEILAGDLVNNLMQQIKPFKPGFTLGERVESIEKKKDGSFLVVTNLGTEHLSKVVVIAAGLGCFEPRKPLIDNLDFFERKGVDYIVKDPKKYTDCKVVISGGGDSALDWASFLANNIAKEVTLIHRRDSFRGHPDSVDKIMEMTKEGKVNLITNAEVTSISGESSLSQISIKTENGIVIKDTDFWIPLFGLTPKLGPIASWGLNLNKNAIEVYPHDYSTNIEGVYAIGDINTYPGKLKLILSGFHEAALMAQSAFKHVFPEGKKSFKYTTVLGGIKGF